MAKSPAFSWPLAFSSSLRCHTPSEVMSTRLPIFADIAPQRVGVTTVWFGSFDGLPTNQPSEHSVGISEAGLYTLSHAGNACSVASCTLRDSGKSADVYLRYPCQHHSYSHSGGRDGKHIPHRLDK